MGPLTGPTVVRRQLGRRIRLVRQQAGKSLNDVETSGILSKSTLQRYEGGRSVVHPGTVLELCMLYGVDPATTQVLYGLANGTQSKGWWEEHTGVLLAGFGIYLDLEGIANSLRIYDPELIHGLLQTPEYFGALGVGEVRSPDESTLAARWAVRHERQNKTLHRTPPCRIEAILGAAALARIVGSPGIMTDQIDHLREVSRLPNVQIRVLPWSVGAHPGLRGGAFTVLEFDEPADPTIVYLESHLSARYLEEEPQVSEYEAVWHTLVEKSAPMEEYTP